MKKVVSLFLLLMVAFSCEINVSQVDVTAPGEVANLIAIPGDSQIILEWQNPDDADFSECKISYGLYNENFDLFSNYSGEQIIIDGLVNNSLYTFLIQTTDSSGNTSQGITISETPSIQAYSVEISNLITQVGNESVLLSWSDPVDDNFNHCEIYYGIGSPTTYFSGIVDSSGTLIDELTNDSEYCFVIFAVNSQSERSTGVTGFATPGDFIPPAEVSNLTATAGDGYVTLSWTDPDDEDFSFCEINYSNGESSLQYNGDIISSGTEITGLTNYIEYNFTVFTVDSSGNRSSGKSVTKSSEDQTPCNEVSGLSAEAGESQVELNWNAMEDQDFDHYLVYYGSGNADTLFEGTLSPDSTIIDGLEINTSYTFKVYTVDTAGNVSSGVSVNATTRDLSAAGEVENLTAQAGDHFIELSWDSPADSDLDHFLVFYGIDSATTFFTGTVDPEGTRIENLINDTSYKFKVITVDQAGNQSTGITIIQSPVDLIAPADVTAFTTLAGNEKITLSWTNPADEDFSHCILMISNGGAFFEYSGTLNPSGTVIDSLEYGVIYSFKLQTTDSNNNLSDGVIINATPIDTIAPDMPEVSADINTENFLPTVEWTCPVDATGFTYRWDNEDWITQDDVSSLSYTTSAALSIGSHTFQIQAIDRAGNASDTESVEVNVYFNAPDSLSLEARAYNCIYLSWNDNSSYEDEFIIERDSGSGFTELARTTSDSYSDETCNESTGYSYRVYAVHDGGNSNYTSEESAVTLTALEPPTGITSEFTDNGDLLVSWTASIDEIDSYTLVCKQRYYPNNSTTQNVGNTVSECTLDTLPGKDYIVSIQAVKNNNSSVPVSFNTKIPTRPDTPSNGHAEDALAEFLQINVSWTDNCTFETGYNLYRKTVNEEDEYTLRAELDMDTESYQDEVEQGKIYKYLIRAVNNGVCSYGTITEEVFSPVILGPDNTWVEQSKPYGSYIVWYKFFPKENTIYEIQMNQLDRSPTEHSYYAVYKDMNDENAYFSSRTDPKAFNSGTNEAFYIKAGDRFAAESTLSVKLFQHVPFLISFNSSYLTDEDSVDLGTYQQNEDNTIEFNLYNKGFSPIYTENLSITLDPFNTSEYYRLDLSNMPDVLAPGEISSFSFDLIFNPEEMGNCEANLRCGWKNDFYDTQTFYLTALADGLIPISQFYVDGVLKSDRNVISFGTASLGEAVTLEVTVQNSGEGTLEVTPTYPSFMSGAFTIDVNEFPVRTSAFPETFHITFTPNQVDDFQQYFYLTTNDPYNEEIYFILSGTGSGANLLVENEGASLDSGATLDYGTTVVSSDYKYERLTLLNTGDQALNIHSLVLTDQINFRLDDGGITSIAAGGSADILVYYTPQTLDSHSSTLVINSEDYDIPAYSINLIGEGFDASVITPSDNWVNGEITSYYDSIYYFFNVTSGETYEISWIDSRNNGSFTGDIKVSCLDDEFSNIYFTNVDDGYTVPKTITPDFTGIVILKVKTVSMSSSKIGNFIMKVIIP